jgi:C-terminal binding-module, SLH-like, of glucodextranase
MKSTLLFIALILPLLSVWAGPLPLVTISDPPGDDYGAGTLVYPQRADFKTGDLDLLQLKISRDDEGFWFEAMFKNPIRDPVNVPNSVGAESLADFARKGFYQFNLDVYIDTDRVKGSGNTFTLPGRQVKIDPGYAWEKAVILTPRPELMRQQLLAALIEQYPDRTKAETEASVDQAMFFPTRILVRGRSISFFVPAGFFAGSDGTDWAVTALVTGAMTTIPADLSLFPSTKTPLERLQLGVMQPVAGRPKDTFGYRGATPSPVVDMLASSAEQQVRQLTVKDDLTGVYWVPHAVNDIQTPVAASGEPIAEQKSVGSIFAKPVVPIGNLLQPETPTATKLPETKPAEVLADPSIARRLQTLQQLFDQKLIDEAEYKQQKQRILNAL